MSLRSSRRAFLIRSGWIAGGITAIGVGGCSLVPPLPTFSESQEDDIYSWVQLCGDGSVRFLLPRAELGQGIGISFAAIVAEELQVPVDNVHCHYQDTALMAPCQMTVGSQSVENYLELIARSAACLRETLRERAAARLGVPPAGVQLTAAGFVAESGRPLRYRELLTQAEDTLVALPRDQPIVLLSLGDASAPNALTRVNRCAHGRHDPHVRAIVTGAERYSRDVQLPNLHFGVLARPPQLGARLASADRAAAAAVDGVQAVVEQGRDIGVVATTPMAATLGLAALAPSWHDLSEDALAATQQSLDIDEFIERRALDHGGENSGELAEGERDAVTRLSLRYDSPTVAHAAMEPRSGVASWRKDQDGRQICEIWTGSQDPWMVQAAASKALGLRREQVIVRNQRVGGAFGGRVLCQASVEAAWLSRGAGVPVKVQWSREEEFRYNYVGPQFSTRIDAGLDRDGRIAYWHHRAVGAPVLTSSMFVPPYLHWLANRVPDPGTRRGMAIPYQVAHTATEFADERVPMPTGPWRGLGAAPNTFAVECAIDELARAAGRDPIEFRQAHLPSGRLAHCLSRLRQMLAPLDGAFGVAAAAYKGVTFLAIAAQVELTDAGLKVTRILCVHDCGRMVSVDQVRAQVEGNLIWGIGMALKEAFLLEQGIAATDNFDRYTLPRQSDVPELTIQLVDSEAAPSGAAEAAFAPAAAAIANACFAVTGVRQRQLPLISPQGGA